MTARQYTVRGISDELDQRLRDEAQATHRSVNRVVLETLRAAKLPTGDEVHTDLDWFIDGAPAADEEDGAQAWLDAVPSDLA